MRFKTMITLHLYQHCMVDSSRFMSCGAQDLNHVEELHALNSCLQKPCTFVAFQSENGILYK